MNSIKIKLHVLSPIHIGCDDVYEPTSFVIDENKKKLIEFDPMDFIKALPPKEKDEFSKICSGDNLLAIFKFIKRSYMPDIGGKEVEIATGILEHYKKAVDNKSTYNNKEVINQFSINRTAYNPQTNQPYIPGSSLKGSLRTAYLSALANVKGIKGYQQQSQAKDKAKDLEKVLLNGSFETDPFRMVKVSDLLPLENVKSKILYAVNRKKKESDKASLAESGPTQIFESIQPGCVFDGTINIQAPAEGSGVNLPVTEEKLKSAVNKFYIPLLESDIKTLKTLDISVLLINEINSKFKGQINKTVFLIRIGRHSGAEAVTIEGNRHIKIMQGRNEKPKYLDRATTFWLASEESKPKSNSGLTPFGWAVLEVVN